MTDHQFSREFAFARKTLIDSSEIALRFFSKTTNTRLKADNTVVTEADEAVEAYVREKLTAEFPDYGFIGEESEIDTKDISWLVDPIDGTSAYARGIPDFSQVLALVKDNAVIFSIIYLPILKTTYHAITGQGAFKDDSQIHVSQVSELRLGTVTINSKNFRTEYSRKHAENLAAKYRIRVGYAGTESCLLAQGSIDVLIKFYQHIWDVAPECHLITEAGGFVTDEFGHDLQLTFDKTSLHNYIATTPTIHNAYKDILYFQKK